MIEKNVLILGVSSGFGKATAIEFAKAGYNVFGVHLDLGSMKDKAEELRKELETYGIKAKFYNQNAASHEARIEVVKDIVSILDGKSHINVLLHSIAFSALGPLIDENRDNEVTQKKMEMTMNVMANSLLYWTQEIFHEGLLKANSKIFAMTSNGSNMATTKYGPVSVAKSALECLVRQLAFELAPYNIQANSILAGPTETPASSKIPNFDKMLEFARKYSPYQRNTRVDDVAGAIVALADDRLAWITGQTIKIDGGQGIFTYIQ